MKLLTIIGARPQFIKAAAVSRVIAETTGIQEVIAHTGQHFDPNMSAVFFEEMCIPKPHYHLDVHSLPHGAMTGRMLEKIEEVWLRERPDFTLVYGDTNSTLAGALAAKKQHGKVVHIEAGLRSFNMAMPEEINRILTDRISDLLFCPTKTALANLNREGFAHFGCEVLLSGDVMEDAALFYSQFAEEKSTILQEMHLENQPFLLCTIHRAENTDDPARLKNILYALNDLANRYHIVLPLHPRTRKILEKSELEVKAKLLPPVGYFDMLQLLRHARMVLTDSGGLQKEAYFFNRFCITLRDETEWTELVEGGWNALAGADTQTILETVQYLEGAKLEKGEDLYGGGTAARFIVNQLMSLA